jgi:hypothetical protein
MKIHSLLAGTLLLAAPVTALVSGCGGGGSGSPFPTPTATPIPTFISDPVPTGNLSFVTTSTGGIGFGSSRFVVESTVVSGGPSTYTVGLDQGNQPKEQRGISFYFPDASNVTLGKTYQLANSGVTVLAVLIPPGAPVQTFWGGTNFSQGSLVVQKIQGNRITFRLQNVVLTRRPSDSGPNQGTSQLKVSGTFSVTPPSF